MISKKEVEHIAKLARLKISEEEKEIFQKDLSSILDYFDSLKRVETDGIEPIFQPRNNLVNVRDLRKDEVGEKKEKLVGKIEDNFPNKEHGYLKVKAIL